MQISISKIPEFSTNFLFPAEIKKSLVAFVPDTGYLYAVIKSQLYICSVVAYEVIQSVKIKGIRDSTVKMFEATNKNLYIVYKSHIAIFDVFKHKTTVKPLQQTVDVLYVSDEYLVLHQRSSCKVKILTHNFVCVTFFKEKKVVAADMDKDNVYYANENQIKCAKLSGSSVVKINTLDEINIFKILPRNILAVLYKSSLSIYSTLSYEELAFIQLETSLRAILANDSSFFLFQKKMVYEYSLKNFDKTKIIKENSNILSMTCTDKSFIISTDDNVSELRFKGENYYDEFLETKKIDIKSLIASNKCTNTGYKYWVLEPFDINILHLLSYYGKKLAFEMYLKDKAAFTELHGKNPLDIAILFKRWEIVDVIINNFSVRLIPALENSLVMLNKLNFRNLYKITRH